MDELGASLVDRVLPDVPYRQWVLSLPWDLRALCARRADVLTASHTWRNPTSPSRSPPHATPPSTSSPEPRHDPSVAHNRAPDAHVRLRPCLPLEPIPADTTNEHLLLAPVAPSHLARLSEAQLDRLPPASRH